MTGSLYAGTGEGLPQCSADTRKRPDQQGCEGGAEERAPTPGGGTEESGPTPGGGASRDSVLGGGASGIVSWVDTLPSEGGWGAGGGARCTQVMSGLQGRGRAAWTRAVPGRHTRTQGSSGADSQTADHVDKQ